MSTTESKTSSIIHNNANISLSNSALEHILEIQNKPQNHKKFLRISISSGGCSEFQYIFELDSNRCDNDIEIAKYDSKTIALTDETSIQFLKGARIDFIKELGSSYFKVNNPNASSGCGCGSSFSIKEEIFSTND